MFGSISSTDPVAYYSTIINTSDGLSNDDQVALWGFGGAAFAMYARMGYDNEYQCFGSFSCVDPSFDDLKQQYQKLFNSWG